MNIIFTSMDRSETLELPIVPLELRWDNEKGNLVMDTLNGEILFYGKNKLTKVPIESFFPNKYYSWAKSGVRGREAVGFFTRYKNEKKPLRMIISNKKGQGLLNILVAIDNFNHGYDRVGDVPYSLSLTEYIPPNVSPTIQKQQLQINLKLPKIRYKLRSGSYKSKKDADAAVNKILMLKLAKKEAVKVHSRSKTDFYWEIGTFATKKDATTIQQKIISTKIAQKTTIIDVRS